MSTLRGYFDCSGQKEDTRLTLAGYIAAPDVWTRFGACWWEVLKNSPAPCTHLHMKDANALKKDFSEANGWTKGKVDTLLGRLIMKCFLPASRAEPDGPSLMGAVCTIERDDFDRAAKERPDLAERGREAICAEFIAEVALSRMPQDPNKPEGYRQGQLELYFDRNEPYRREIESAWRAAKKRPRGKRGPLSMIADIDTAILEKDAGLQAADFLAWHVNRSYSRGAEGLGWRINLASPVAGARLDYARLMEWQSQAYLMWSPRKKNKKT